MLIRVQGDPILFLAIHFALGLSIQVFRGEENTGTL